MKKISLITMLLFSVAFSQLRVGLDLSRSAKSSVSVPAEMKAAFLAAGEEVPGSQDLTAGGLGLNVGYELMLLSLVGVGAEANLGIANKECDEEVSIGNYILTGGEIPAMVISDSLIRLLPGTLGNPDSNLYDSFSEYNSGMLEAPLYTRPEIIGDNKVPDILLSGNHSEIEKWRLSKSLDITKSNRPDLKI